MMSQKRCLDETYVMQPLLNGSYPSKQHSSHLSRVVGYFNNNRKKVFLILCAFITGTWIGSSIPNYRRYGLQAICPTADYRQPFDPITKLDLSPISIVQLSNATTTSSSNTTHPASTIHLRSTFDVVKLSNISSLNFTPTMNVSTTARINITAVTTTMNTNGVTDDSKYIVYTPSCRIPRFDPRDPSIVKTIVSMQPLNCALNRPVFTYLNGNVLSVNTTGLGKAGYNGELYACCYSVLQRKENRKTDDGFSISSNCTPIEEDGVTLTDEFVKVICKFNETSKEEHVDFLYTVPLKPQVEERISKVESRQRFSMNISRPFSVMMLGLDAVSRLNFERHLRRTRQFLLNEMHAIEIMGYNKVGENTFPNLAALLTGYSQLELSKTCWKDKKHDSLDNCTFLWSRFSELGFRTMYGEDSHLLSTFNYLKGGFYQQPTDYYLRPFSVASEKSIGLSKSLNTRLCLGSRPVHEVSIGWAFRFMETMATKPYFGLLWSNSLTHDDANYVQRADKFLFDNLVRLKMTGSLNDTVLIMISDHGIRWGALRKTRIGSYEDRLPALHIVLPARFQKEFPEAMENLKRNSNRLTSTFDLHKTLLALASLGSGTSDHILKGSAMSLKNDPLVVSRGVSLFELVPWNRTCSHAGIDDHFCACEENVPLDVRSSLAQNVAEYVVRRINKVTSPRRNVCSSLTLDDISGFVRKSSVENYENSKPDHFRYVIIIQVVPSKAIFEATVIATNDYNRGDARVTNQLSLKLDGEISRINMYGKQSACITDLWLKNFCFCKKSDSLMPAKGIKAKTTNSTSFLKIFKTAAQKSI